ncbi:MAG: hypothetical protein ACRELB_13970 [Polyangiaceae bacterium]
MDGAAVEGAAPYADALDVTAGKHTLEARLGAQSAKVDVDAKAGQVSNVEITIPPAPPALAATASTGAAPPSLAPSSMSPLPETPQPEGSPAFWNTRREVGVGVAAAGLVALGVSAYFYADGNSQRDRASALAGGLPVGACDGSSPPASCSQLHRARDAQNTDVTLRNVFVGVGAAAVLVGAGLLFWPSSNHSQTAIVPFITPESGGLQVRGEL